MNNCYYIQFIGSIVIVARRFVEKIWPTDRRPKFSSIKKCSVALMAKMSVKQTLSAKHCNDQPKCLLNIALANIMLTKHCVNHCIGQTLSRPKIV